MAAITLKYGTKVLWDAAKLYRSPPIEAEYVGESMARYHLRYRVGDNWIYRWAGKDRVRVAPKATK